MKRRMVDYRKDERDMVCIYIYIYGHGCAKQRKRQGIIPSPKLTMFVRKLIIHVKV